MLDTASDVNCVSSIVRYYLTVCFAWITARIYPPRSLPSPPLFFTPLFSSLLSLPNSQRVTDDSIHCIRSMLVETEKGNRPRLDKSEQTRSWLGWKAKGELQQCGNNSAKNNVLVFITNLFLHYLSIKPLNVLLIQFIRKYISPNSKLFNILN